MRQTKQHGCAVPRPPPHHAPPTPPPTWAVHGLQTVLCLLHVEGKHVFPAGAGAAPKNQHTSDDRTAHTCKQTHKQTAPHLKYATLQPPRTPHTPVVVGVSRGLPQVKVEDVGGHHLLVPKVPAQRRQRRWGGGGSKGSEGRAASEGRGCGQQQVLVVVSCAGGASISHSALHGEAGATAAAVAPGPRLPPAIPTSTSRA